MNKCINSKCPHGNFDPDALTPCAKCEADARRMVAEVWEDKAKQEWRRQYEKHKENGHKKGDEE